MDRVVEKAILLIPERMAVAPVAADCGGNAQEMFVKFGRHVLINRLLVGQFQGDLQHHQAVEAHPRGGVRLIEITFRG